MHTPAARTARTGDRATRAGPVAEVIDAFAPPSLPHAPALPMNAPTAREAIDAARMTAPERRATTGLATIFGLRMLGMFIILPVFALHAETLPGGASHALVGVALGAYALAQALLQVPFGWASDRLGRKRTIVAGLVVFAVGSFVAAAASDIAWTIVGRTLQGAGAVSAAVIALTADLTRDEVRTKAMGVIGATIGATFAVSLVLGPLAMNWVGVPGIFAATGVLALAAIGVLTHLVPDAAARPAAPSESGLAAFRRVLADKQLLRLNYGIFALHAVLMALFVQIPFELRDAGLAPGDHWRVYLPVLAVSIVLMLPFLRRADRPESGKRVFVGAVALLAIAEVTLALAGHRFAWLVAGLVAFFTAFNFLEAALPSLVSKFAPPTMKGTAVGVYSSVQYLGTFAGAVAGGVVAELSGAAGVFALGVALTAAWLVASASMPPPPAVRNPSMGDS